MAYGLHDDHTPSLQLYPDGTFYCYGCRAGGSIYDFAARLWGTDTKGRQFLALRARLASTLGLPTSAQPLRAQAIGGAARHGTVGQWRTSPASSPCR